MLVIGFSVVAAMLLLIAYLLFIRDMRKTPASMVACTLLLTSLTCLQLAHWYFLQTGADLFAMRGYVAALLLTPPSFYFFSREVLQPGIKLVPSDAVHFLPITLSFVLPADLVIPVALTIGAGYAIWLVRVVLKIRTQVRRFKFEVFFFGFFALVAVLVLFLAIASSHVPPKVFYLTYANMTGLAMFLVLGALVSFPDLLTDISAAAELTYASSTLKNVDVNDKLGNLKRLMEDDKLFQNENLNLGLLAEALDLTPHQLSEMINTQFGHGFSRYIREQRVAEARKLLRTDHKSSVLAISMMIGFKSQSNFYTAFREVTGQSPGEYRKNS